MTNRLHLLGIRHHGPGSARALLAALAQLNPDVILVEGPDDANPLLPWLIHAEMEPPVALILYKPDEPKRAAFFPFAVFSPEYQALRFGLTRGIPTRFFDLPQRHMLAARVGPGMPSGEVLHDLARAGGFDNYERWWNHLVEQRRDPADLFAATHELMTAARAHPPATPQPTPDPAPDNAPGATDATANPTADPIADAAASALLAEQREAYMRRAIRAALDAGAQRVAVVCGAWHTPALAAPAASVDRDDALLAQLTAVETEGAWVPWTYGRLSAMGGYGAGILAPGWYHHLWTAHAGPADAHARRVTTGWLAAVADLLRDDGHGAGRDVSAAHIIESVRLAEALAALRGLSLPGLEELNEAALAVMCQGDARPLQLIRTRLVVGERMGQVPGDAPMTPLQRDLRAEQTRLRLQPQPELVRLALDLRVDLHLERSRLLHRLALLEIDWGAYIPPRRAQNSHRELWNLLWRPGLVAKVVAAGVWGNTIRDAAEARARDRADNATRLADLTELLNAVILADLPDVVAHIMARVEEEGVLHTDVPLLMDALPPLVRILRYGSTRRVDRAAVRHAVDVMLTRVCVGLLDVCRNVNDDAAEEMVPRLQHVHALVGTLRHDAHAQRWRTAVAAVADDGHSHPLLAGRSVRLLLDAGHLAHADVRMRLTGTLDHGTLDADHLLAAGQWLDGFLRGADTLLVRDDALWALLDDWIAGLDAPRFMAVLPLLRRAFASFGKEARGALLDRVRRPTAQEARVLQPGAFDPASAGLVLPTLAHILHIDLSGGTAHASTRP